MNYIPVMYDFNLSLCFWAQWTLLHIARTKHENNVEDDFTEYVYTFLVTISPSTWDKYFSLVSKMIIYNEFYIWENLVGGSSF